MGSDGDLHTQDVGERLQLAVQASHYPEVDVSAKRNREGFCACMHASHLQTRLLTYISSGSEQLVPIYDSTTNMNYFVYKQSLKTTQVLFICFLLLPQCVYKEYAITFQRRGTQ